MNTHVKGISGGQVFTVFVVFFAIVIAVNATLAVLAMRSWTGLVVENGYVASQAFNKDLAEARRQAQLGWRESFGYANGELQLILADSQQHPITHASVVVKLERPSTDREDRQLTLNETGPGRYVTTAVLAPGLWDAEAIAHGPSGETLRRLYRLHVSGEAAE